MIAKYTKGIKTNGMSYNGGKSTMKLSLNCCLVIQTVEGEISQQRVAEESKVNVG